MGLAILTLLLTVSVTLNVFTLAACNRWRESAVLQQSKAKELERRMLSLWEQQQRSRNDYR